MALSRYYDAGDIENDIFDINFSFLFTLHDFRSDDLMTFLFHNILINGDFSLEETRVSQ